MKSAELAKVIVAVVPLGLAVVECVKAERETIEVARVLSMAGNASAEAACRDCP